MKLVKVAASTSLLSLMFATGSAYATTKSINVVNTLPSALTLVSYTGDFAQTPPTTINTNGNADLTGTFYFFRAAIQHVQYSYDFTDNGVTYKGTCDIGFSISPIIGMVHNVSQGCPAPITIVQKDGVYIVSK